MRYYGLQAKYEGSIGLSAINALIDDCNQAFTIEFIHPNTGAAARISSFYAVNAGTFSDEAREYFFKALRPKYADNIRLIDGRELLKLDRLGAITLAETRREVLAGLLCEVEYNLSMMVHLIPELKSIAMGDGQNIHYPPMRFRLNALSSYLVRPIFGDPIPLDNLQRFWLMGINVNTLLDGLVSSPIQTVVSIKVPAQEILSIDKMLLAELMILKASVSSAMSSISPFATV